MRTPALHGRLEHVVRAVDQHLDGQPRLLGAVRDAHRGLVEDDVDAAGQPLDQRAVADVALDDAHVAVASAQARFSRRPRERSSSTMTSRRPLSTSSSAMCEPTRPEPAGDQRTLHHHPPSVAFAARRRRDRPARPTARGTSAARARARRCARPPGSAPGRDRDAYTRAAGGSASGSGRRSRCPCSRSAARTASRSSTSTAYRCHTGSAHGAVYGSRIAAAPARPAA